MDAVPPSPTPEHLRQVRALFEAALKLAPAEQRAFLHSVDSTLRGEVERLLLESAGDGSGCADNRVAGPTEELGTQELAETVAAPSTQTSQRIGPYRLERIIGEGGMGTVWLATQEKPVRRTVALKVIKLGMDTKEVIARFESERQALALMDHPNIARMLDAGAASDGRPYFVMEYVRGIPITRYCDERRLQNRERMALFVVVCQAVQHAHQRGVIHRDLKPSNVLITEQDGKPVPKIIDFGIAKAINQRLTEQTLFTRTGALIGTPEYMSPEQAETDGLDVSVTTDVYSLGVVLYELMTGLLPFEAKILRKAGYEEMRRIIREQEPPTPARRVSSVGGTADQLAGFRGTHRAGLVRLLRGDIDWITLKALEKDRRRRYQSPAELADDLERHLRDQPVLARPPSTLYRVRKALRRRRGTLAITAAVIVALSAGLVALWNRPAKPRPFDSIGVARLTSSGMVGDAAISPDATAVAYELREDARVSLRLRTIASGQEIVLVQPFDGDIFNIRYTNDGQSLYYSVADKGIFQIPSSGGIPTKIFDRSLLFAVAPDGKHLAGVMRGQGETLIGVVGTDGSGWKDFIARPSDQAEYFRGQSWLPDGKTIAAFAVSRGVFNFEAFHYPEGTRNNLLSPGWAAAASSVWLSDGKTLLFVGSPSPREDPQIWRVDFPEGSRHAVTNAIHYYHTISLSRDDRTLAAVAEDWSGHLWTIPIRNGGSPRRITTGLGKFGYPSWSSNGHIFFEQEEGNRSRIGSVDQSGLIEYLADTPSGVRLYGPAPCGPAHLVFVKLFESGRRVLTRTNISTRDEQNLAEIGYSDSSCTADGHWVSFIDNAKEPAAWRISEDGVRRQRVGSLRYLTALSPDGKKVAGLREIKGAGDGPVRPRPVILDIESGSVIRTVNESPDIGGNSPIRWTRDGRALTYIDGSKKLVCLPVDGSPATVIYDFSPDQVFGFDWSPDGNQIVVARGQITRDIVLIRDTTNQ